VTFGDGANGLVPRAGELIVAAYRTTAAEAADLAAGAVKRLSDDDHNRAILPPGAAELKVTNPVPALGGAEAETLEEAEGRAGALTALITRAVTLGDYERLAVETPGARIARAHAIADLHPDFSCVNAIGVVTVVIVPYLPRGRPAPSAGLARTVAAYLNERRIVGTRLAVTGPTYTEMHVQAQVRASRGADLVALKARVLASLDAFFDPLHGGRDGTGWPFGRDVVRTEVFQEIEDVPGVDHVLDLELIGPDGASCGNLCIGPLALIAASGHQVEVVAA
jgi:predicted phage baseplate assembly protein